MIHVKLEVTNGNQLDIRVPDGTKIEDVQAAHSKAAEILKGLSSIEKEVVYVILDNEDFYDELADDYDDDEDAECDPFGDDFDEDEDDDW